MTDGRLIGHAEGPHVSGPRSFFVPSPLLPLSLALTLAACGGTTASHAGSDASADSTGAGDALAGGADVDAGADAPSCDFCLDAAADVKLSSCPSSLPGIGAACDLPDREQCEYGSSWWLACNTVVRCVAGTWSEIGPMGPCPRDDAGGACPATFAEASAIDAGGSTGVGPCPATDCQYPDGYCECLSLCGGGGAPRPMVLTGRWYCAAATAACPSPRPDLGTACSSDAGCQYGQSCGCGQALQCTDGIWQGFSLPPCP